MKKYLPANAGDARIAGLIPGSGRSTGVGNGNPFQCSCLKNSMDRGAWWAIVHWGCKDSDTAEHAHVINDPLHIKCGVTRELCGKSACRGA